MIEEMHELDTRQDPRRSVPPTLGRDCLDPRPWQLEPDDWLADRDAELDGSELAQWRHRLAFGALPRHQTDLIDLLRDLEDLKSMAAAIQACAAVAFDMARREAEADLGIPQSRRGVGVGAEVALARRESPHRGGRLLGLARALVNELPTTLQALAAGTLNEWRATLIARETACLEVEDRAAADLWLGHHLAEHPALGDRRLVADVRRKVIDLDQHAVVRRRAQAAGDRRVTLQPLPDGMVRLSAILPLQQGVAVYATLRKTVLSNPLQTMGVGRGAGRPVAQGALMADTLVELVTGRAAHSPSAVELMVVITDQALLGVTEEPAHVDGYGPMPANWVRQLVAETTDPDHTIAIRRLFRAPGRTALLETSRRFMTPALARLIAIRDQRCRTPWCDAPIRHQDHVVDHAKGGKTSLANGQGLCEACNYTKQQSGWTATPQQDPHRGHIVNVTTPTGHRYQSTQPAGPLG